MRTRVSQGSLGRRGPLAGSRREGGWASGARAGNGAPVAGANGRGGLRWLEPMVEPACMHVWAPCQALV
jgi:hypothetical protein